MNVPTNVKSHFRTGFVIVDRHFISEILRYSAKTDSIRRMVDFFGTRSAESQGLSTIITTFERIRIAGHTVYLHFDSERDEVVGMLKVGRKKLFIQDVLGEFHEIRPLCCLDFYVHESVQRRGIGKKLFEFMLTHQKIEPEDMGYDRPSSKLMGFLLKHYDLRNFVPQVNKFVVFNDYFIPRANRKSRRNQIPESQHAEVSTSQDSVPAPVTKFTPPQDRHRPEPPGVVRDTIPVGFDIGALERAARETGVSLPRANEQDVVHTHASMSRIATGVGQALVDVMEDDDEAFRYKPVSQSPLRKKELNPFSHAHRSRYSRYY